MRFLKKFLAFFTCYIVPSGFTLGFHSFGKWYDRNGFYKFSKGDVIRLSDRRAFGYGINPMGIVVGYDNNDGKYLVNMMRYVDASYFQWADTGRLPTDARTVQDIEKHFKWNIENQFCRVF